MSTDTEMKDVEDVKRHPSEFPEAYPDSEGGTLWDVLTQEPSEEYQEFVEDYREEVERQIEIREKRISEVQDKIDDWSSRTYKRGKTVQVGGGHEGRKMNVQTINRRRRDKKVNRLKDRLCKLTSEVEELKFELECLS
ncbi:MAG: hypothetical protein ABEN55_11945 [Bradymonadaceae bacterium]